MKQSRARKQNLKTKGPGRVLSLQTKFQNQIAMKKSEIISLTEYGCGLTIDANKFTYSEVRSMARQIKNSGGSLTIRNTDVFSFNEIKMICEEGRGHITLVDVRCD